MHGLGSPIRSLFYSKLTWGASDRSESALTPASVFATAEACQAARPHTRLHRQGPLQVTAAIDRQKIPYQQAELQAADSERKAAVGRLAACGLTFLVAQPVLYSGLSTADYTEITVVGGVIVLIAALEVWLRRAILENMLILNRSALQQRRQEALERRAEALRQQGLPVVSKDLYQAEDDSSDTES
ncbi:hypothetical protein D9Q98_008952 [Chlorella vulgaris]|uniref:Uncharacterized protein n=1 Tax=Chlorella vulgaris TaxID=3077 RepID=A0A9D4YTC6_CHLVU|nr:hypothetical protein D9Q98_008952 [Chlorella vulgaris]